MKLAILIPDRGDRPAFLRNCLRMMANQTLRPIHIEVVDFAASDDECDITKRYRVGYDKLRNRGFDLIALIENDDWYSLDYLKTMVHAWENAGRPDLIGTGYTIYYHIFQKRYLTMHHSTRASAMNTLIKPDLNFDWCNDNDPYTDLHLWKTLNGKVVKPEEIISIGIKHGIGLCGGAFHNETYKGGIHKLTHDDPESEYLKSILDSDSFDFYTLNMSINEV